MSVLASELMETISHSNTEITLQSIFSYANGYASLSGQIEMIWLDRGFGL